jgi:threonylcarbamoyl-AMP synthase-like protein
LMDSGRRVAAISARPLAVTHAIALPASSAAVAHDLFDWLRRCDELGVDVILIEGVAAHGLGRAVMDRLLRAATVVRRAADPNVVPRGASDEPAE